jgi:predicted Kef-type K+ transport protein
MVTATMACSCGEVNATLALIGLGIRFQMKDLIAVATPIELSRLIGVLALVRWGN